MRCPTTALPRERSQVIHFSPLRFQENLTSSHKSHLLASCVPRRRFMCLLWFSLFHRRYQEGEGEDRWRMGRSWQVTFQTRQCEAGL